MNEYIYLIDGLTGTCVRHYYSDTESILFDIDSNCNGATTICHTIPTRLEDVNTNERLSLVLLDDSGIHTAFVELSLHQVEYIISNLSSNSQYEVFRYWDKISGIQIKYAISTGQYFNQFQLAANF